MEAIETETGSTDTMGLVRALLADDESSKTLGITVVDAEPGHVTMALEVSGWMLNGHGILHGGYLFLLGDTCFAFVCESLAKPSVSRQAEITFIAPGGRDDRLIATGREVVAYGRNNIVDVSVRTQDGRHLAEVRVFGVALKPERTAVDA
ncbi:MAG: hypothetical protein K0S05_148 [Agromyces sp.]|jgi:acyl-CoA thioesterase|nr:hypothetical protein [Agromyces sp.]